jgi:hypothetical protein
MTILVTRDAAAFADRAWDFLQTRIECNILATVLTAVRPARSPAGRSCSPVSSMVPAACGGQRSARRRGRCCAVRSNPTPPAAGPFPDAPQRLAGCAWPRAEVARNDLLDAYAVLWTALRVARGPGHHRELGDGRRDAHGLRMRIVV